jgi:hypothetical protein
MTRMDQTELALHRRRPPSQALPMAGRRERTWHGGYDFDDGDLMLRIEPRRDGTPLVVEVRSLTAALTKIGSGLAV